MMATKEAISTCKFAIRDSFALNCGKTGLRAGDASENLADNIFESITRPDVKWAFEELFAKEL